MLKPLVLTPFTANEIHPTGWLERQLRLQAQGLSGNLDKISPDIRDSRWIGGDREGWERVPYWLDGFIPLAYLLRDEGMIARAQRYVDAILAGQQEDGWICPCGEEERLHYDMWALFLILKVLVVYHECTGDGRIEGAVYRALWQYRQHLHRITPFSWAASRWFECLIPIYWLYERNHEAWLEELALTLSQLGVDYERLFDHWRDQQPRQEWSYTTHVVNLAMCLKSGALLSRITGGDPNRFARQALAALDAYHGNAVGHFNGDECLSGPSPIQGTELCGVVEAMYSYETLLQISGEAEWADRLERLAYNALPATISPDMWSHQYDQMANQVQCSRLEPGHTPFLTNDGEAHLFGLEPNYGCCTANFNQGWPKFALSTWMRTGEGLALAALAPCAVETRIQGVRVRCEAYTAYPFRDELLIAVEAAEPIAFELAVRIPGSACEARVADASARPGTFHRLARKWPQGRTEVAVTLRFKAELLPRPSGLWYARRGPLTYCLPIETQWVPREYEANGVARRFPYCDYELLPRSEWRYGFYGQRLEPVLGAVGDIPFDGAPIGLKVTMAGTDWGFAGGIAAALPEGGIRSAPEEKLLVPYGCARLRLTEMPQLADQPQ